jgi:hypothetical protein
MQTTLTLAQGTEAIAEVFWLAFTRLSEAEQKAVLQRLSTPSRRQPRRALRTAHIAHRLMGLVSWGGDALEDSELFYDQ